MLLLEGSTARCRRKERRADAYRELAADELEDAIEFRLAEGNALLQLLSRTLEDAAPDAGPPARHGRAMNAVKDPDAIDAQAVQVMELEEERVAVWQGGKGCFERLLVHTTVADLQVVQVWIDRACKLRAAFQFDVRESARLATDAKRSAHRNHAEPARERAAAGVLTDP